MPGNKQEIPQQVLDLRAMILKRIEQHLEKNKEAYKNQGPAGSALKLAPPPS